jgi:uncharacterized membrane protein HdeD (DUF308 family)
LERFLLRLPSEVDVEETRGFRWLVKEDLQTLSRSWSLFAVRGVLALVFGALVLQRPLAALTALVFVFGAWAFVDGVAAVAVSLGSWRSWQLLIGGVIGIGAGVLTFVRPGSMATAIYSLVAAWAIVRGVVEIYLGFELRKRIQGEAWLFLAGLASIVFGVLMVAMPAAGVLALGWLLGIYALVFGTMNIGLSLRLYRLRERMPTSIIPPPLMP